MSDVVRWSEEELKELHSGFEKELKLEQNITEENITSFLSQSQYFRKRAYVQAKAKLHYIIKQNKKKGLLQ